MKKPITIKYFASSALNSGLFQQNQTIMKTKTLIIQNSPTQKLSRQQLAFNRNIKKVENLQRDVVTYTRQLEDTLTYYVKHVMPVSEKKRTVEKMLLSLFYDFLHRPKFLRPSEKTILKSLMRILLNPFLNSKLQEPDADIKKIFQVAYGIRYEEVRAKEFEGIKMDMKTMFDDMGLEMDMNPFNHDMTEEDMARYVHEMKEKMRMQEKEARLNATDDITRESKRQLKERLAQEARNKSMSSIYKTLAKTLHPDLERDESKRGAKEELMKQVTAAYQNKDLHTLLKLELSVLHNEEQHTDKLSNEKIMAYNELLREQIDELQMQIDMLPDHPKYRPLLQFVNYPDELFHLNLSNTIVELKNLTEDMQRSLTALQGGNGNDIEKKLRTILKEADHVDKLSNSMKNMMNEYLM